ncbi:sigma-70 family RNA polymerase sigma factor [Methylobacterium phyllosphaerae]
MGADNLQPHAQNADEEAPTLSDEIRQHLGRLLAAAYEEVRPEPHGTERFADLLAQLAARLDEASRRDAAEFQARLLAMTPVLRRFATSLTRDVTSADDLVQDTLLRAWRSQSNFTMGTNLEAWLFTILRNVFYSQHRKHGREVADSDGNHAERLVSIPEQDGHLDLGDMRAALDRLTPTMREALILVTVEDRTYEEAAVIMGCQIGTVKSRVWRAREQIVRMLGYGGSEIGTDAVTLSVTDGSP